MAVATHKTASVNLGSYIVSVAGTLAEVEAELAAGADIGAGFECGKRENIIASGGDATAFAVLYIVR